MSISEKNHQYYTTSIYYILYTYFWPTLYLNGTVKVTGSKCYFLCCQLHTVRFPYRETCALRKWGKTKEKGGVAYKAGTCFMVRYVSEKCQSQMQRPLEHMSRHSPSNVSDKCFCTDNSQGVTLARRMPTLSCLHSLNTFQVCSYQT
jgi:hypothetical protein